MDVSQLALSKLVAGCELSTELSSMSSVFSTRVCCNRRLGTAKSCSDGELTNAS